MAERWAKLLGREVRRTDGGGLEIGLEGGRLAFAAAADAREEGVCAVELRAADRTAALSAARERGLVCEGDAVTLCGTRLRLV